MNRLLECHEENQKLYREAWPCLQNVFEWTYFRTAGDLNAVPLSEHSQDTAYYQTGQGLEFPEMVTLPLELRQGPIAQALLGNVSTEALERVVAEVNRGRPSERAISFTYFQTFPAPDTHRGRILFYVPGPNFVQWVQFSRAMEQGSGIPPADNVSIVAVQTRARSGEALQRPLAQMLDLRWQRSNNEIAASPRSIFAHPANHTGGSNSCATCHENGTVALSRNYAIGLPASRQADFRRINQALTRFMNIRVNEAGTLRDHLPVVGPENRDRPDSFLRSCALNTVPQRWPLLREAMNCAQCHNGETQRALHYIDPSRQNPVRFHLQGRTMPPDDNVLTSSDDRRDLIECLSMEHEQQIIEWSQTQDFRDWAENRSCWNSLAH